MKTLRLDKSARERLREDCHLLPANRDAPTRDWQRWLAGDDPNLRVTFGQDAASESGAVHLSVLHPLVRQAAHYLGERRWPRGEAKTFRFAINADAAGLPAGEYSYGLYHWDRKGAKPGEEWVVVAENPEVEKSLLSWLANPDITVDDGNGEAVDNQAVNTRHHKRWNEAHAAHLEANRLLVEHRTMILRNSHKTRLAILDGQIAGAKEAKIRRMREAEKSRAESDFSDRLAQLKAAAESGDIHVEPMLSGIVTVKGG